jgi:DNA-binding NtrC family response regulator
MEARILIVDDEPDICEALTLVLAAEGYAVSSASSGEAALEKLKAEAFELVLTDLKMGACDGMAVLEEIQAATPRTAVVMMTAYSSVETAVSAMKKGAADYIVKPFLNDDVVLTVRRILEHRTALAENVVLKRERCLHAAFDDFIASSEAMRKPLETLVKVSPTKSNVLILGESGTGKGLIAELIHRNSPRRDGPFISINCSAIPEGLLESELFGYRKGAFTGAASDKPGLIAMADNGTLFLDEIGDMALPLQAKLLKVVETGELCPLGDTRRKTVDMRLLAATNAELEAKVKAGAFRADLYWRLSVVEIKVPPLRERKDDIAVLIRHFTQKFSAEHGKSIRDIDGEVLSHLIAYSWPGNVRELKNAIERCVVLADQDVISPEDLPERIRPDGSGPESSVLKMCLSEYEKGVLVRTYQAHEKSKEATAAALGIDLATLYRKFRKYGIAGD